MLITRKFLISATTLAIYAVAFIIFSKILDKNIVETFNFLLKNWLFVYIIANSIFYYFVFTIIEIIVEKVKGKVVIMPPKYHPFWETENLMKNINENIKELSKRIETINIEKESVLKRISPNNLSDKPDVDYPQATKNMIKNYKNFAKIYDKKISELRLSLTKNIDKEFVDEKIWLHIFAQCDDEIVEVYAHNKIVELIPTMQNVPKEWLIEMLSKEELK